MFLSTQSFRFLDIINYLGPGTSLWEVREKVRKPPDKIMAAVWVVWLCTQTGLWGFAAVSLLVLKTEERVCLVTGRVWRMPASVPGEGNKNVRRLVRLWQQSGCRTIPGSAREKMRRFYSGLGVDILKTLCRFRGCHCSTSCVECCRGLRPRVVCAGEEGVWDAQSGSSGRAKSSFH